MWWLTSFFIHWVLIFFSLTKSKYSGLWVMSDLEAALGKQSPWQHYHKSASSSVKGPTWSMRIYNLGKQSFLQVKKKREEKISERTNLEHEHLKSRERELPSSQKKKGRRYQFKKCLCINLSFLALLFILHEGGLYTLNYPNDETWSHVKILLSCFLYGQNKLLRYEKMMVFFF